MAAPAAKPKETWWRRSSGLLTPDPVKAPSSHWCTAACHCQRALSAWISKVVVGTEYGKLTIHGGLSLRDSPQGFHGSLLAELRDRFKLDLWGSPRLHFMGLSLLSSSGNKLNYIFSFLSPSPPPSSFQQTTYAQRRHHTNIPKRKAPSASASSWMQNPKEMSHSTL